MAGEFAFYDARNSKHPYNNQCGMNYATLIAVHCSDSEINASSKRYLAYIRREKEKSILCDCTNGCCGLSALQAKTLIKFVLRWCFPFLLRLFTLCCSTFSGILRMAKKNKSQFRKYHIKCNVNIERYSTHSHLFEAIVVRLRS